MTDDDDPDAGGDFFIDLMKTIIAIFCFVMFVSVMCSVVWWFIT
jgi:hypothetical protein